MKSALLMKDSTLAEDIHLKTREASWNTDYDMRVILAIDKGSQTIQDEVENNKKECKTLKEFEEQKQLYRDGRHE